ncbi:MAG: hypothetical protein BroJett018_50380 [Chloroflexota bacterium]|nr:MAG: hypothetical protein BroJett018_50380 [Chloroflexota bacterium]
MARVLKIACGLMGVLLLVIVGVMEAGRNGNAGVQTLLISSGNPLVDEARIYLTTLEIERYIPLTPKYTYANFIGWIETGERFIYVGTDMKSVGGEWRYFSTIYEGSTHRDPPRLIADHVGCVGGSYGEKCIYLSPNRQWLLYYALNPDGSYNLERVNIEDRQSQQLNPPEIQILSDWLFDSVAISADSEWVAFTGQGGADGGSAVYVMRNDGSEPKRISPIDLDDVRVRYWIENRDWLIVQHGRKLHKLTTDGQTFERLTANPDEQMRERVIAWFLDDDYILVADSEYSPRFLTFVPIGDDGQLWTMEHIDQWKQSADGKWTILYEIWAGERKILKVGPDGSELELLSDAIERMSPGTGLWGLTPDEQWILYTAQVGSHENSIWRVNTSGGAPQRIATHGMSAEFLSWSPDGQWVIYRTEPFYNHYANRVRIDGTHNAPFLIDGNLDMNTVFDDWGPLYEKEWQPPTLAVIALTFITTPILLSRLRRQHFH